MCIGSAQRTNFPEYGHCHFITHHKHECKQFGTFWTFLVSIFITVRDLSVVIVQCGYIIVIISIIVRVSEINTET